MKNVSQELILRKKEFDSSFSIIWSHFHICIESPLSKLKKERTQVRITLLV